jgi:hypothetical protein
LVAIGDKVLLPDPSDPSTRRAVTAFNRIARLVP